MLPVVPLFHANSWGIAFSAPSMGTKLVMPGAKLDGASVYELLDTEKVTHTAGVPTVWLMLLNHMAAGNLKLPHLKSVVCGGSAMPRSMIKAFVDMGVGVRHAWGMTEMSPIGTLAALKPPFAELTGEERLDILQTQGYPPFGVEMKITDDAGKELPWDGKTFGRLKVAGPAVAKAYFRVDTEILDDDGFFDTGDVATIDAAWLHADHRPLQGCHQVRRRMDFVDRSGKSRGRPPRGRGSGRDRRLSSQMGRAPASHRPAQAG